MRNKSFVIIIIASFILSCVALWRASAGPSSQRLLESIMTELNEKPEVIAEVTIKGMRKIQEKMENTELERKQEKLKLKRAELENDDKAPFIGNPKGDIVITEFFDYHCGHCRRVDSVLEELIKKDPSVRVIFREYPIFGDATLAKAALAAHKQKRYKDFHASLMNADANLSEDALVGLARSLGLDGAQFVKDMNSPAVEQDLKANLKLGEALEVSGTPCFIVGGTIIPGAADISALEKTIAAERLKKARTAQ